MSVRCFAGNKPEGWDDGYRAGREDLLREQANAAPLAPPQPERERLTEEQRAFYAAARARYEAAERRRRAQIDDPFLAARDAWSKYSKPWLDAMNAEESAYAAMLAAEARPS